MSTADALAPRQGERHRSERIGWLRAAVLGANDGIVSTASLVIGIAAAQSSREQVLVAGVAGLVAGAMSMAAGEYVSVSSQSDTERADLAIERAELAADPHFEREELAEIYVSRGLDATLAREVAHQLMAHDALGAHARDELGFSHVAPDRGMALIIAATSLLFLIGLGGVAAGAGGAPVWRGALRVAFWGALAMVFTALVGWAFGVSMA